MEHLLTSVNKRIPRDFHPRKPSEVPLSPWFVNFQEPNDSGQIAVILSPKPQNLTLVFEMGRRIRPVFLHLGGFFYDLLKILLAL